MTDLFAPLDLGGVQFRNRIGVAPMCQYCCAGDGKPTDWHLAHLMQRAIGGAATVITEANAVTPEGRITPRDLGLWEDGQIAGHARLAAAIAAAGAVPGTQIAHAGRKAGRNPPWRPGIGEPSWTPLGPSAVAFDDFLTPKAMSEQEIGDTIAAFAATAKRAVTAGYRLVELHAAHGYLLHQFLSPLSNQRNDGWGGDWTGRTRLVREATAAVRAVLPAGVVLAVRISHTDWVEGGWTTEESVELAKALKAIGVDLVDTSSGGLHPAQQIPVGPGYQVPGARRVREEAGIATAAVGLITEPDQAQQIIAEGSADMVFLARAVLRDPYWPMHAAVALGRTEAMVTPPQYDRGWPRMPMAMAIETPLPAL
jgi:2,4-dienoyl-CoA reductase-like NADH-dependent reductase (Old Yellow Enzyme family)